MCARRNDTEIDASRRPWPYIHTYAVLHATAKAHCGSIALYHQISRRNHADTYGIADRYYPMLTQIYHNSQSLCVEYNIFSRIWARPSAVCGTCCDLHMNWASQWSRHHHMRSKRTKHIARARGLWRKIEFLYIKCSTTLLWATHRLTVLPLDVAQTTEEDVHHHAKKVFVCVCVWLVWFINADMLVKWNS